MARAGYGNMAMTACFAGPLCNILCGLGLGWLLLLLADSPQRSAHVVRHFLLVCTHRDLTSDLAPSSVDEEGSAIGKVALQHSLRTVAMPGIKAVTCNGVLDDSRVLAFMPAAISNLYPQGPSACSRPLCSHHRCTESK